MNRPQRLLAALALCSLAALLMLPCRSAYVIGCAPFPDAALQQ